MSTAMNVIVTASERTAIVSSPSSAGTPRLATNRAKMKTDAGPPPGVTVAMERSCMCALTIIGSGTEY
ncbi:MAG: hypothetical protein R2848_17735 [Thermomicrobiales bacterium]